MRRIYMDGNATTPLLPEVFEAMRPFLLEQFGNASSSHLQGQRARSAVEQARDHVAKLLRCRTSEVVFTSGGTESDNMALFGVLAPGDHLITTTIEHHAVLHAAEALSRKGVEVTFLQCDRTGTISPEALTAALRANTRLVSIMLANNETGTIQPVPTLAQIAKTHGALFHTDAVQGAGKLPLDLGLTCSIMDPSSSLKDVDLLSLSGHKMYAPQGTGVLFVRGNVSLTPLLHGGTHERQRRAGTENVAGIVALGKAAEMAREWLANGEAVRLAGLRDRLETSLLSSVERAGVNGIVTERTANTTNLYFDGVDASSLLIALDLKGLSVSAGSACSSGATEPSHVLTAMGLERDRARASIRISLTRMTTATEVEEALEIIPAAIARLRSLRAA